MKKPAIVLLFIIMIPLSYSTGSLNTEKISEFEINFHLNKLYHVSNQDYMINETVDTGNMPSYDQALLLLEIQNSGSTIDSISLEVVTPAISWENIFDEKGGLYQVNYQFNEPTFLSLPVNGISNETSSLTIFINLEYNPNLLGINADFLIKKISLILFNIPEGQAVISPSYFNYRFAQPTVYTKIKPVLNCYLLAKIPSESSYWIDLTIILSPTIKKIDVENHQSSYSDNILRILVSANISQVQVELLLDEQTIQYDEQEVIICRVNHTEEVQDEGFKLFNNNEIHLWDYPLPTEIGYLLILVVCFILPYYYLYINYKQFYVKQEDVPRK